MKYVSVFFSILVVGIVLVLIAALVNDSYTTYRLYQYMIFFTLVIYVIGFWRNS